MRKNLVKKILSISIVSLVCALVLATIVLALIPKKLDNPVASGYTSITVYKNNLEQSYYKTNGTDADSVKENEIYSKIESLHAESLNDSLLSALFQGVGSFGLQVTNNGYSNALTQAKNDSDYVIVFTYTTEQKLMIDGKEYRDEDAFSSKVVTFDMIVMPLGSSASFEQCTIYLADREDKDSAYQVNFLAHQGDLLEYVESLDFPVVA